MRARSALSLASAAGALIAIVFFSRRAGVHWRDLTQAASGVEVMVFARLVALFAASCFVSSQKWRLTYRALVDQNEETLPTSTAFALTSIGAALGLILPIQLSMSIARTLGSATGNKAVQRGTVGTLFEQAFDFAVVCLLACVSLAVYLLRGGPWLWLTLASIALASGTLGIPRIFALAGRVSTQAADPVRGRVRKIIYRLLNSGLLHAKLGRRLFLLSVVRFVLLVFMAREVAVAIGTPIPLWHLAAALPIGVVAIVLGITPGGLGLLELSLAGALTLFGTPLVEATKWTLMNRILMYPAGFMVAAVASLLLIAKMFFRTASKEAERVVHP